MVVVAIVVVVIFVSVGTGVYSGPANKVNHHIGYFQVLQELPNKLKILN